MKSLRYRNRIKKGIAIFNIIVFSLKLTLHYRVLHVHVVRVFVLPHTKCLRMVFVFEFRGRPENCLILFASIFSKP